MHKAEEAAGLEDLLRLQEQFKARSEAPAAKVTFVGGARRQAESASTSKTVLNAAESQQGTPTGDVESQDHEAADSSALVGDVVERVVEITQPPTVPTHPAAGGGFPLAKHRRQSRFALSRKAKQDADAPTGAAASQGGLTVNAADMAVSGAQTDIDAENLAALQNMSPLEVEAARKEVEERLGPEKVAFLRKRAAQRSQQAAHKTEPQDQPTGMEGLTSSMKATASHGTWTPQVQTPAEVPRSDGAETKGKPVSRIRFSLSGEPVGWKSAVEEEAGPNLVVERDLLRQDEGTISEVYTVHELCQLARSSLPAQRAFACRHLASLLARARPSVADAYAALYGNGKISKPLLVPGSDQAPRCDWEDVWEHALKDCQVAVVLRLALDDSSQSVITEAAEALAALVAFKSMVPSEACPTPSGLAAVPSRYLERPHVQCAWSVLPVDIPKPPEMPSMSQNAAEEDLEQQLDERQVAAKDPLAGLLQMQVLARISYLLQTGVGPAATHSLLSFLRATALGGDDMVSAICSTHGLVKALLAILDDASPDGSGHAVRQALHPVRPSVLCVLRSLCQAGADVARHLLSQGLKAQVIRFVLGSGIALIPAGPTAFLMQIEAVRIWRVCACYGLTVMSLDEAYPMLLPRLGVPEWPSLSAPVGSSPDAQTKWLAAEMLMTVAELLLHAGRAPDQARVSPRCAEALLQEAMAWLHPQPLQEFLKYVIQRTSVKGSSSDSENFSAQAALLALAGVLEIVRACILLPYMKDAASKAAALVADMSVHTELRISPQEIRHSQGSFVCKLLDFLKQLLGCTQDDGQPTPDLAEARAGVVVATCEVLSGCLRTCHAADSTAGNALEQPVTTLPFPRYAPELVSLQPSAAGAFQVQQAILNLVLTGMEHALQRLAAEYAWEKVLDAVLRVPSLASPGGEDLALRAMSCALHERCYSLVHQRGTELVSNFSEGGSSFAIAAGMLGAWWQEGDAEVKRNPLPVLPGASAVQDELLPAYTAHWLGLIPEGPPQVATANGPPAANRGPVHKQSLMRQPVGSRLPTPPDWMFGIEPVPADVRSSGGLETISEEGEPVCTPQFDVRGRAHTVGVGLLFLLSLEAETALPCMLDLPTGVKFRGLMDLVFSPANPSSCKGEGDVSDALWLDPLIRWTAAALLDIYACHMPTDRLVGSITEADAAQWAAQFATVSYGDALFASALALLLRPNMPEPVQVTVLEVLAEEGALHLLPPLGRAPGEPSDYFQFERPKEVTRLLGRLLEDGSLQKAKEANSMVYDLAVESQTS